MDRHQLLIELHAGRERLRAALATIPDAAMLDPVDEAWTRKDVIAHLGAWERRVVDLYELLRRGEQPEDTMETDELNARLHAASRDRPLDDVRTDEADAWQRLLELAEGATEEELFDPDRFAWTQGDPFVDWVTSNAHEHIDEHLDQLTRPSRSAVPGNR
jgi:hypothetical protein